MDWQTFGFRSSPLETMPIKKSTLELFTGHAKELQICASVLKGSNVRLVIEGARGVGTTSFANYLRFNAELQKGHFTPRTEIKVESGWRCETLLAAIISNFVREIELRPECEKLLDDKRFKSAKALSSLIAETYRSFGVDAFGFGASYGKQTGLVTQPMIVPSTTLGHHLEDLIALVRQIGYKHGALFQLNNLDIGEIHQQSEIKALFNALRDYTQTDGSSWLLVGDVGLRRFIAQEVDRLDDIISYEVEINPIALSEFAVMIDKRIKFYSESEKIEFPVDQSVFDYLYQITHGRLRYIFGLASRLMHRLYVGDLTDKVTLDIAQPMLVKLARDRVRNANITASEKQALALLVSLSEATVSAMADQLKKSSQYVGRLLASLVDKKLIFCRKAGRERIYSPSIDASIAYSDLETGTK